MSEADVDQLDLAAARPGRLDQVTGLELAEGDRAGGAGTPAGHRAGVGADPGRQVDRDGRDARRRPGPGPAAPTSSGSPGRPPMPSTPSITRSACRSSARTEVGQVQSSRSISRPPAARSAASPRCVRRAQAAHGRDRSARGGPAGPRRTGRRRRCCPGRPRSAPGRRRPGRAGVRQLPGRDRGQPAAPPAASRCRRRPGRMAAASSRRIVVHRVRVAHQASQTTTAEAMPASWDRETWMVRDPQLGGPGGDRAGDLERRLAAGRRSAPRRPARTSRPARRAPWPAPPWPRTGRPARRSAAPPRPG